MRENTVSLLSGLVEDMELNSDMKLRLNEAAQLLAPKQLVTEVIRRSCEATTSGYFGIKRITNELGRTKLMSKEFGNEVSATMKYAQKRILVL